jgi:hypothetical protein
MPQQLSLDDVIALDPEVWFSTHAMIKDKRAKMVRAPKPNVLQKRMFEHYRKCQAAKLPCKMIVLKPRQKGASTCSQAIIYHHYNRYPDLNGSLMGDIAGTSDKVFDIFRRFATNDSFAWDGVKAKSPKQDLADLVELNNKSKFGKETAGSKNAGRSGTIQVGNLTEVAFWNTTGTTDPALAYLQSLYDEEVMSLCIADSTPNGPAGWFYNTCMAAMNGDNDWKFVFAAWFEFEDSVYPFRDAQHRAEFESSVTDEEVQEQDRYGLTLEQMHWRRRILMDKCDGDSDKFRQEYPSDPVECFLMSSRPRFNIERVTRMSKGASKPKRYNITKQEDGTAMAQPDLRGVHDIWEEPRHGCKYLISVDTCTGEDQQIGGISADPDYHSVQVWRHGYHDSDGVWHNHRMAALHHSRLDTLYLAEEIEALSIYYGGCMVVPEVNNSGLALVKFLQEMGVAQYQRRKYDDVAKVTLTALGWDTNRQMRKTIIDELARAFLEETIDIPSADVLKECRTFVINKKGKPEAAPNHHDDHVMSAAIAVYNISLASMFNHPGRMRGTSAVWGRKGTVRHSDGFSNKPLDMGAFLRNVR